MLLLVTKDDYVRTFSSFIVFLDLARSVNTARSKHCSLAFFVFGRLGGAQVRRHAPVSFVNSSSVT